MNDTLTIADNGSISIKPRSAKEQYMALRASRKGLVLDQIAHYADNAEAAMEVKRAYGLEGADWTQDIVTGRARVWGGDWTQSTALLQFNYDLGIELEVLTYLEGPHWHEVGMESADNPFLSHLGFHVNEGELPKLPFPVAQELITESHSNAAIAGRSYHYIIYDARPQTGCFLKYIKRRA